MHGGPALFQGSWCFGLNNLKSEKVDSETIANLTDKISLLSQENSDLKKTAFASTSLAEENENLKEEIKAKN